jgi:hypothetical protein
MVRMAAMLPAVILCFLFSRDCYIQLLAGCIVGDSWIDVNVRVAFAMAAFLLGEPSASVSLRLNTEVARGYVV